MTLKFHIIYMVIIAVLLAVLVLFGKYHAEKKSELVRALDASQHYNRQLAQEVKQSMDYAATLRGQAAASTAHCSEAMQSLLRIPEISAPPLVEQPPMGSTAPKGTVNDATYTDFINQF